MLLLPPLQAITYNKQLREQIDNLRRERMMFEAMDGQLDRWVMKGWASGRERGASVKGATGVEEAGSYRLHDEKPLRQSS